MGDFSIEDLKPHLGADFRIVGDSIGRRFTKVKPILEAEEDSLAWISLTRKDKQQLLEQTKAGIVICDESLDISGESDRGKVFILVKNPRLVLLRVLTSLFPVDIRKGVHPTAVLHPEAMVHPETAIGPFTYIGKSRIGRGCVIHGNCHIYDNVEIGESVTINAGVVVGADGFGYERNEMGSWERLPHIGGVVVYDDVDIGAHSCIIRGTLGNTVIGKGTKLGYHVIVGHNARIEENVMVAANSVIGGSSVIGEGAWISVGSVVLNSVRIGAKATVGPVAGVVDDVPDFGKVAVRPACLLPEAFWNKREG